MNFPTKYNLLKKFIQLFINNNSIINKLEQRFINNAEVDNFFLLLEEKVKTNKNIIKSKTNFINLLYYTFKIKFVDQFLFIINKDYYWFILELLQVRDLLTINRIIGASNSDILYEQIIPAIITFFNQNGHLFYQNFYFDIITIFINNSKVLHDFLFNYSVVKDYSRYLLISDLDYDYYTIFYNYLQNYFPHDLIEFDEKTINLLEAQQLVEYVYSVPNNRRLALFKLIKNKDEENILLFIQRFPEFESLITMI